MSCLYEDVVGIICDFVPEYKFRDWVDEKQITLEGLCANPHPKAIEMVKMRINELKKYHWDLLSSNPFASELLKENIENVNLKFLCSNTNPDIIPIIKNNISKLKIKRDIVLTTLSMNPCAVELLRENLDIFDILGSWRGLIWNDNPDVLSLFSNNLENDKIRDVYWDRLSSDANSFDLIEQELKKGENSRINWIHFSKNTNPKAIPLIADRMIRNELVNEDNEDNENNEVCWYYWLKENSHQISKLQEILEQKGYGYLIKKYSEERLDNDGWMDISEFLADEKYIEDNIHNVTLPDLCKNHNLCVIPIIKRNINSEYIDWDALSENPIIFEPIYNTKLHNVLMEI